MRKKKISGEIIISAVLIILGIVVMAVSAGYGIWDRIRPYKGFMPFLASLLMSVSSAVWLFSSLRAEKHASEESPKNAFTKKELFWLIAVPGICLAVYFLLNILGMHTTLAIFLFVWLKFISKYSWLKTILWTIILSVAFYLIFTVGLAVPFPRGYLL